MTHSFTRAELYEQVWSRPRTALGKAFGISDVAIGKHCARARIPTPGPGYWARLAAGGKTVRPTLPMRLPGQSDTVVLGPERWSYATTPTADGPPLPPTFSEDAAQQVAAALRQIGRVGTARDLATPDPSLARVLDAEAKRRAKHASDGGSWYRPHFDDRAAQRHLRLFNSFARAFAPLYGPQAVREDDEWVQGRGPLHHLLLHLNFGGAGLRLRVHEPGEPRRDRALKPVTVTTLRVESSRTEAPLLEWSDREGRKIEQQLPEIVEALLGRAEEALRAHAQWVYEQGSKEHQRRLAAAEQQRAEAERRRIEALEAQKAQARDQVVELARRRRIAEDIRATVTALRSHPETATAEGQAKFAAWAAHALAVADDIDPMCNSLASILGPHGTDTPPAPQT